MTFRPDDVLVCFLCSDNLLKRSNRMQMHDALTILSQNMKPITRRNFVQKSLLTSFLLSGIDSLSFGAFEEKKTKSPHLFETPSVAGLQGNG